MHKIINNNFVGSHNLITIDKIHEHNTRLSKSNNFFQFFTKTKQGQSRYSLQGLKFWKTLPEHIKFLPLNHFKQKVKNVLLSTL